MAAVLIYVQHLLGIGHLMRDAPHRRGAGGVRTRGPPRDRRHADRRPPAARGAHRAAAADRRLRRELHAAARRRGPADQRRLPAAPEGAPAARPTTRRRRPPSCSRRSRSAAGRCASSSCPCSSASRRRARGRGCSASVRDILQLQTKPGARPGDARAGPTAGSTRSSCTAIRASPVSRTRSRSPRELRPPVHYTGFVRAGGAMRPPPGPAARNEVVVSVGGGAMGVELLAMALDAQPVSRFRALTWRLLVGRQCRRGRLPAPRSAGRAADDRRAVARRLSGAAGRRARVGFAGGLQHRGRRGHQRSADRCWSRSRRSGETEQRARAGRLERTRPGDRAGRGAVVACSAGERRRCGGAQRAMGALGLRERRGRSLGRGHR